jgi:YHS domain-containing protein
MKIYLLLIFMLLGLSFSHAQEKYTVEKGKIMIDGYDPVSYFQGKPVKGSMTFKSEKEGRIFLFSSLSNKKAFEKEPEKYLPEYGGWCAIAMVDGSFVIPDYSLYKIQDDKLLFFTVRAFFNGLTQWEKDANGNLIKADSNWRNYFY